MLVATESEGKFQENKDWNPAGTNIIGKVGIIRGQVPRKQGLKRYTHDGTEEGRKHPRASSKKTRIETVSSVWHRSGQGDPRASSKKTRIETLKAWIMVLRGIPSEGKFQENKDWNSVHNWAQNQAHNIRGQVPRKQGLKRWYRRHGSARRMHPRASSKKTRIETRASYYFPIWAQASEGKFQENKDWNWKWIPQIAFNWQDPRASSKKTRIETRKAGRRPLSL